MGKTIKVLFLSLFTLTLSCAKVSGTNYPVEQFIFVSARIDVNVCNQLTSPELCEDTNLRFTGSGAVVKHTKDKSYILTAEHVCDTSIDEDDVPFFLTVKIQDSLINLTNMHDKKFEARVFATSKDDDICLLETDRMDVPALKIARRSPHRYDVVYNVAAPRGAWSSENALFFEGKFSGYDEKSKATDAVYILSAMPGSSGSPIVNQRGQLVGLVSRVLVPGYSVVYGPTLEAIKKLMNESFQSK